MNLICGSRHLHAGVSTALDVSGREHLVLIVKATWRIPQPGARAQPLPPQAIVDSDRFVGEPGLSALLYGDDLARYKPLCDVLFDAFAHSAQPVRHMQAGWRIGERQKILQVHGPRHWQSNGSVSNAQAFTHLPLHSGLAFGGSRPYQAQGEKMVECHPANPDGLGWIGPNSRRLLNGLPAPSLEYPHAPIQHADSMQAPAALSGVPRHYLPRRQYGGTYDAHWQQEVFPFLPQDFDERYYQCAPEDQQIPYPRGGEMVNLWNLLADRPQVQFHLPQFDTMRMRILRKDYSVEYPDAHVDTLFFEPEAQRFTAVWRASTPIRRRIQEFDTIAVGPVNTAWWQQKIMGGSNCQGCGQPQETGEIQEPIPQEVKL